MTQESPARTAYPSLVGVLVTLGIVALVVFLLPDAPGSRLSERMVQRVEATQLAAAMENFRTSLGQGEYPPSSNDDPAAVEQFLAKAFPRYHGGLPEKYKNLDQASSLVLWLGGVTDKDGKLIGFSADPQNPFDATSSSRIPAVFEFDPQRLHSEGGLPVYCPPNRRPSEPYVYFRPDAKGEYHGAWHDCRPCRDSTNGEWINPKSYQLFSPGLDGKYGNGVQYPSGVDYDEHRKDDMSNFTSGPTLGNDMR